MKNDAITASGPVARSHLHLKTGGGDLVDEDFLWNAVPAPVLGHTSYRRDATEHLARRKVDDGKQTAGFERAEEAGVNFGGVREMMVHVAHEDHIATFGRKIGVGFAGFDNRDIRECSLGDSGLDVGQPIGIEFR